MSDADLNSLPLLDEETLVELREVMEEQFVVLLGRFLNELPLQLDRLNAAIVQGDAGELHRIAHKFKSGCGVIGAARLAELIQRMEHLGRSSTLDSAPELLLQARITAAETATRLRAQLD